MNAHERRTAPTAAATAAGAHLSRTARIRTDGSAAPETGAVCSPVEKKGDSEKHSFTHSHI